MLFLKFGFKGSVILTQTLSLLKEKGVIDVIKWITKPSICISCRMGKTYKQPFNFTNKISEFHCDL